MNEQNTGVFKGFIKIGKKSIHLTDISYIEEVDDWGGQGPCIAISLREDSVIRIYCRFHPDIYKRLIAHIDMIPDIMEV